MIKEHLVYILLVLGTNSTEKLAIFKNNKVYGIVNKLSQYEQKEVSLNQMMLVSQFRQYVIRDSLVTLGLWSRESEELLLGTAAHESHLLTMIRQTNNGPAMGPFQMEPATHKDIWDNFLRYKPALRKKVEPYISKDPKDMITDLRHATIMARLHYLRVKEKLPEADDLLGQAKYWKKYYNTVKGKGTVEKYINDYNRIVKQ